MNTDRLLQEILNQISVVVKSAVKEAAAQFMKQKSIEPFSDEEDTLSAEQAAGILKLKVNTVYAKVEKKELPHSRSGKRKLVFSKKELEQYLISRKGITNKDISDDADHYILKKK